MSRAAAKDRSPVPGPVLDREELSINRRPMPEAKPIFHIFLEKALEHTVLDYIILSKNIPPLVVFETMESDAKNRARIYHACTEMAEKFAIKLPFARQAADIEIAIETDEQVAEAFVLAVGIDYYIENVPLRQIYEAVMMTGWMVGMQKPEYRAFAALMCETFVQFKVFNGDETHTYEQILKAIGFPNISKLPRELVVRAFEGLHEQAHKPGGLTRLAPTIFDAVSFKEMSQHLEVVVMASPIALYADALGLVTTTGPKASEAPPPPDDDADADVEPVGEPILIDEDGDSSKPREASAPPPLPKKKDGGDGDTAG